MKSTFAFFVFSLAVTPLLAPLAQAADHRVSSLAEFQVRLGLSGLSMSMGLAIVEHNLFERCRGENELISNKSGGNTYRYNTFLDGAGTKPTLRHGNECAVYGNVFRATAGLRLNTGRGCAPPPAVRKTPRGFDATRAKAAGANSRARWRAPGRDSLPRG